MIRRRFSRRRFLQWIGGIAGGLALTVGYARMVEPFWLDVEQFKLPVANLPKHLIGKRIAHISDIHIGPYFTQERLAQAINTVNQLAPDWLILTGDYATVHRDQRDQLETKAGELIEPLRMANMPVFASLGNHDLWSRRVEMFINTLGEAKATVLRNSSTQAADGLWFAGVDDVWSGSPDLRAAMRDVPSGVTTILLAHEPDFIDRVIEQRAPVALQLSGHSHGGQVRIPLPMPGADGLYSYAPIVPHHSERYPIGFRRIGEHAVYTNRGLGCWPIPYRINCRPEIAIFELEPKAA